jgi:hypothetical protein
MKSIADSKPVERVTDHSDACFARELVARRALACIGMKGYNWISRNCEHFARWCATGVGRSKQSTDTHPRYFATGCVHFAYRDDKGRIVEVYPRDGSMRWVSISDVIGAPSAVSDPKAYWWRGHHIVYRADSGHVIELYHDLAAGKWRWNDLSKAAGAPRAFGELTGHAGHTQHVFYANKGGGIQELWWDEGESRWRHTNLTRAAGRARVAGGPVSYFYRGSHVVFTGRDGHVHEVHHRDDRWHHHDLSRTTGAPKALGTPSAHALHGQHVVFRSRDGHVHELYWDPQARRWDRYDLTARAGGQTAASDPVLHGISTQHVAFLDAKKRVVELTWIRDRWIHNMPDVEIKAKAGPRPICAGGEFMKSTPGDSRQFVAFVGDDELLHVCEHREPGRWSHQPIGQWLDAPKVVGTPTMWEDTRFLPIII